MSAKRRILLPSIVGITASSAAGSIGTIDMPLGLRYHSIELVYIDGGASPADITATFGDIVIYRNTKQQRIHTAAELDHLNSLNQSIGLNTFNRNQVNTGASMRQSLVCYFAEPWRKDKVDTDLLAWNVDKSWGWTSFQLKITLIGAIPATGSVVAYAVVDNVIPVDNINNGVQPIVKVYRQQIPASGTGIDITTLDARDAYQVIALKNPSTTGYISKAALKINSVYYLENVVREDNVGGLIGLEMNPANSTTTGAFGYDIVLDSDDPVASALPSTGANIWLHLDFNTAAAGNVVALIARLGQFD